MLFLLSNRDAAFQKEKADAMLFMLLINEN